MNNTNFSKPITIKYPNQNFNTSKIILKKKKALDLILEDRCEY